MNFISFLASITVLTHSYNLGSPVSLPEEETNHKTSLPQPPPPNSFVIIALLFSVSPSVVFSLSIIPRGGQHCGGNWQPSLRRLSARLLICMALIIDLSLQPQIYDGLFPSVSLSPSFIPSFLLHL